jgi:hypothetical protein
MRSPTAPLTDPRPGDVLAGPKLKIKVRDVTIGLPPRVTKVTAAFGLRESDSWWPGGRIFTLAQWSKFVATAEVLNVAE